MDNLTHSLIGAALGQAGLKQRTGLAMPTLILAANLPDIDAGCITYGLESLALRRGITHGPLALLVLPLLLAAIMAGFDSWQNRRGARPDGRLPVSFGWLLALAYVGTLSHPLLDWFNNYGIRLLEPFSHRWFYGDTLFIIDIWILIILGVGIWRSLRRERAGAGQWQAPAQIALAVLALYVGANMAISRLAVMRVMADTSYPDVAVANAVPVAFWRREVLWRSADGYYGSITCDLTTCQRYPRVIRKTNMDDPRIAAWAANDPAAKAFLFWSRMPVAEPRGDAIVLRDQRFMSRLARGNFAAVLTPKR